MFTSMVTIIPVGKKKSTDCTVGFSPGRGGSARPYMPAILDVVRSARLDSFLCRVRPVYVWRRPRTRTAPRSHDLLTSFVYTPIHSCRRWCQSKLQTIYQATMMHSCNIPLGEAQKMDPFSIIPPLNRLSSRWEARDRQVPLSKRH